MLRECSEITITFTTQEFYLLLLALMKALGLSDKSPCSFCEVVFCSSIQLVYFLNTEKNWKFHSITE